MTLKLFIALIISFAFFTGNSQQLVLKKEIAVTAKTIKVDELGNIYLVNDYNIYKLSGKGDTLGVYSSKKYGTISQFDVSIPQKPLILYKEAGVLVELDFTMSENPSPIRLYHEKLINPQFVIHSTMNNGYWIYDAARYELMHFDKNFKLEFSSGNILQQTSLNDFKPEKLLFDNNRVYLKSNENGILVFDQFAAFLKKIHLNNSQFFFSENRTLVFLMDEKLNFSDDKLINVSSIEVIDKPIDIFVKNKMIYFLSTKGLKIYEVKPEANK